MSRTTRSTTFCSKERSPRMTTAPAKSSCGTLANSRPFGASGPSCQLDDDVSFLVSAFDVTVSFRDLLKEIAAIDDGLQLSRFDELFEEHHAFRFHLRDPDEDLLATRDPGPRPSKTRCQEERADVGTTFFERFQTPRERDLADGVVDEVVGRGYSEVLFRVVDDLVGSEGLYEFQIRGAAHSGDLRSEGLRQLDGRGAERPGGTVDEHLLPRADAPSPEKIQRTGRSPRDGGGFLEGHVRRLEGAGAFFSQAGVLGIG